MPCSSFRLICLSTKLKIIPPINRINSNFNSRRSRISCSLSKEAISSSQLEEGGASTTSRSSNSTASHESVEDEFSHVINSKCPTSISVTVLASALVAGVCPGGQGIFEATVSDHYSPLYITKVVLRRLTTIQAKCRGRRAIEVLKRLERRRLMYHSYSMQVYGYVCSPTTDDSGLFTLAHGYHGSFSLRHWLQQ